MILVHVKAAAILSSSNYFSVYIKLSNLKNCLPPAHLDPGSWIWYSVKQVSKSTWLFTTHMLSILANAALSRTKCAGPTIALRATLCNWSICLTTWMSASTASAQQCGSFYFVGITTVYSWTWCHNIHSWVFFYLFRNGWHHFSSRQTLLELEHLIRLSSAKVENREWRNLALEGVILVTFHILGQMLWNSDMIPRLALVYFAFQSNRRHSTDVGQQHGWR